MAIDHPLLPRWGMLATPAIQARWALLQAAYPTLSCISPAWLDAAADKPFALQLQQDQLTLVTALEPRWSGIAVDFLAGGMAHRRRQPVGGEMVVKAVWGRGKDPITVLDATAGLGRDGFLLASSGATVVSCERHAAIALLLADGHWRAQQFSRAQQSSRAQETSRAQQSGELDDILARWTLQHTDALRLMAEWQPDVIYLDPMFPEREKTALVKKEMRAFRELVGEDQDAQALFDAACQFARKRVVVKRPSAGESLGRKPSHVLEGKSNRFDVYAVG